MAATGNIEYIQHVELKDLIKDKSKIPGKDYLVVDVRDDDYVGGNIPNCVHLPSALFKPGVNENVENVKNIEDVKSVKDLISLYSKVPQIIFTCALSQKRGPESAKFYSSELLNKGIQTNQKVQVLRKGIVEWQSNYKDDPELIENYDKEIWDFGYF